MLDKALMSGRVAKWSYKVGLHGRLLPRYYTVISDSLEPAVPLRIGFASDFHAGPTTHSEIFKDLFAAIAAAQLDVLLLGGDFVSGKAEYFEQLVEGLKAHKPPLGTYAVFGNHDLWADCDMLATLLKHAGVQLLINQNVALPSPYHFVSICGIDDPWTGEPDMRRACDGAQAVRIFLTHSPDGLLFIGHEQFAVGFAGHTHGGQVALPDGTPVLLPHGPLSRSYTYGIFKISGNGTFIVSRGVGCSTLPVRVNADPELVICTLCGSSRPGRTATRCR